MGLLYPLIVSIYPFSYYYFLQGYNNGYFYIYSRTVTSNMYAATLWLGNQQLVVTSNDWLRILIQMKKVPSKAAHYYFTAYPPSDPATSLRRKGQSRRLQIRSHWQCYFVLRMQASQRQLYTRRGRCCCGSIGSLVFVLEIRENWDNQKGSDKWRELETK